MVIPPPSPVAIKDKAHSASSPQASPLFLVAFPFIRIALAVVLADCMVNGCDAVSALNKIPDAKVLTDV